jgi:hypothetical protein
MAVDRRHIGYRHVPFEVTVDAARVRAFAAAIGIQGAELESGIAPPTYLKVVEGEGDSSRRIVAALGVDLRRVIHADQEFEYGMPVRAGDQLTVERVVRDIYDRKDGALEFIVIETTIRDVNGVFVGQSRQTILVRNTLRLEAV